LRQAKDKWCLKSCSLWLKARDQNTNFFHKQARTQLSRNNVKEVVLDYGTKILDFEALKEATTKHFHSLFTHQSKANPKNEVDLIEHIPTMITNEENSKLTRPIEEDEIKNVIWSLEPNNAPGLDGFSISFYRYFWELIKFDMKRMLQYT